MPNQISYPNSSIPHGNRGRRFFAYFLLIFIHPEIIFANSNEQGTMSDFAGHSVIYPKITHGRTKQEITSTLEDSFKHTEFLTINFETEGIERVLDLWLNKDLISVDYQRRHQHQGEFVNQKPTKEEVELCQYQGKIRGTFDSWAAISTCNGLNGVVYDGKTVYHVHSPEKVLNGSHYLYKDMDLAVNKSCGYEDEHPTESRHEVDGMLRYKRDATDVKGAHNANKQTRYIEVVFVVDRKAYENMDYDLGKVYQRCKDLANVVHTLYKQLNIFVALVGVEVWSQGDQIRISPDSGETLTAFNKYRSETLVYTMPNDNAQLITDIKFMDNVVGKAELQSMCRIDTSAAIVVNHSELVGLVAGTIAHEIGHTLGMHHDTRDCYCPDDICIMNPASSSNVIPRTWSSCSRTKLYELSNKGLDYCLKNLPRKLFDGATCGNGFVEAGEECDCGTKEYCDNPCCDANTCRMKPYARCAAGECCDLTSCNLQPAGSPCRPAERECDVAEYCSGRSEYCPTDAFRDDGESCANGYAYCYQGSCRTRDQQCQVVWGSSVKSSDTKCYERNMAGLHSGNCGYDHISKTYKKCLKENVMCGLLHCDTNQDAQLSVNSAEKSLSYERGNRNQVINCRTFIAKIGLDYMDPGLTPNGATCGVGKMCVNQVCVPVSTFRKPIDVPRINRCPNNCNGNGVCTSSGQCHCYRGYVQPRCDRINVTEHIYTVRTTQPSVDVTNKRRFDTVPTTERSVRVTSKGRTLSTPKPTIGSIDRNNRNGSLDNGPAERSDENDDYILPLLVVFLGIIPIVVMITMCIWCLKHNKHEWEGVTTWSYLSYLSCSKAGTTTIIKGDEHCGRSQEYMNKYGETKPTSERTMHLNITKPGLISTTNMDVIAFSNNIASGKFLFPKCSDEQTLGIEDSHEALSASSTSNLMEIRNHGTPQGIPGLVGSSVTDYNKRIQRGVPKFVTPLSALSTLDNPSRTREAIVPRQYRQVPVPSTKNYYHKKAPPPPVPEKSLKPMLT